MAGVNRPVPFEALARALVKGDGHPRDIIQLIEQVRTALTQAYADGVAAERESNRTAPKLGAVYALENARNGLQRTIDELRRDIEGLL